MKVIKTINPGQPGTKKYLDFSESKLRVKVFQAGDDWQNVKKRWKINYKEAVRLGLEERIIE